MAQVTSEQIEYAEEFCQDVLDSPMMEDDVVSRAAAALAMKDSDPSGFVAAMAELENDMGGMFAA